MMKALCLIFFVTFSSLAQDRIVFERRLDGNTWDIFLMRSNGLLPTNLTNGPEDRKNLEPAISPDGKRIAFSSNRNAFWYEIFVMDLVTRAVRRITHSFPYVPHAPEWSPDGQRIVFSQCDPSRTNCDIFTINADGTGTPTPLANSSDDDDHPHFSPDGTKVVFASNRDGSYEIYVCRVDGSNLQRLTSKSVLAAWPNWSPDGTKIIFTGTRHGPIYELYLMNADGSNLVRLTHSQGNGMNNLYAVFSSDGRRVVWQRSFGSRWEIVEASVEAMDQPNRLTVDNIPDHSPDYGFVTRKVRY